jgi:hypothetical protein
VLILLADSLQQLWVALRKGQEASGMVRTAAQTRHTDRAVASHIAHAVLGDSLLTASD